MSHTQEVNTCRGEALINCVACILLSFIFIFKVLSYHSIAYVDLSILLVYIFIYTYERKKLYSVPLCCLKVKLFNERVSWRHINKSVMDSPQNQKKEITSVKKDLLDLIHNKVFLGRYVERRYVESLQAYRDIIVVESKEEIASKLMLSKKISETFANNQWIGISNDPQNIDSDDILLWVQLNNVTIGKHWFLLSDIKFESREIILETQYVQPYRSPDRTFNTSDTEFPSFDIKEIMTYKNMCEVLKFSAIVVMALFTFAIEALKYLGEYSIKLSYVIVSLIHVSTPICLGMFDFFTKCVGGFLWLIYVMFKGTPNTPAVPAALLNSNQRQLSYQRSIQYKYGVTHNPSQSYSPEIYRQCHSPEIYRQSYSPEMYKQSYSPERDDWAECRKRHDSDNFM